MLELQERIKSAIMIAPVSVGTSAVTGYVDTLGADEIVAKRGYYRVLRPQFSKDRGKRRSGTSAPTGARCKGCFFDKHHRA